MSLPLESVPNFSEGRDATTIDALRNALAVQADVLDVHSDPDHNRSVFTLVGDETGLVEALLAAVALARERIDLARHKGAHPRIGAADVVPIVALEPDDRERAQHCALRLAQRIGERLWVMIDGPAGRGQWAARSAGSAWEVDGGVVVEGSGRLTRVALGGDSAQLKVLRDGLNQPTTVAPVQ